MERRIIKGLISAVFTPFNEDGSINYAMIPSLVDKQVADGLSGMFVCGSNGEGPNMTTEERMKVSEAFVAAARKRLLVIVHVGHSSIAEARTLAAHAEKIGADAFSSVAAFYFKPVSVLNLAESMAAIASAAPALPFYYYHIPHLTGISVDMPEFLRLAAPMIPNLNGIKYTAATIHEFQDCLEFTRGKFQMLFGFDELLLPALSIGAEAAIGSTYTFAAPIYLETIQLYREGKIHEAKANHLLMVRVIKALAKYPPIPAQKAIMKMLGWNLGQCRLPLPLLSNEHYTALQQELKELNFFERLGTQSS